MNTVTISREGFGRILDDVEHLIKDIEEIVPQGENLVKKRIADIKENPTIGKTEEELDAYLQKRGVKIDRMDR